MKKKVLIGIAVIGASVAVLGGCGRSENTAKVESTTEVAEETTTETVSQTITDDNSYSIELDESKRSKFNEETNLYSLQGNGKIVNFQLPKAWEEYTEFNEERGYSGIYQSYIADDAVISVSFNEPFYDNKDEWKEDLIKRNWSVTDTTVDGLDAFFVTYESGMSSSYLVPLTEGYVEINILNPLMENRDIEKYYKYLDMIASSVDINTGETATTTGEGATINYTNWHELSVDGSDSSGYTFNRNIKISNWFSEDKKEELEKIWSTISDDPFPDDSSLGLLNGGYYTAFLDGHKNFYDYTDVFYAIGTVDLENTTANFTGTADIDYNIKVTAPDNNGTPGVIGGTMLLTNTNKLYEASGTGFMDSTGHYYITKKVSTTSKDNFVIMGLIRKTPNEPEGDYNLNETTIHFCYEELPISID